MFTNSTHRSTLPAFLVTIDTEGDNMWARPRAITTENARYLPRFQALCETHGFKPVYLTNYEMATCPCFREFARDVLERDAGEIGMHLHAWNSPPCEPLTSDDYTHQPYLIEYPDRLLREKVAAMTTLLEETFGTKMVSHRAGRWAMNETYACALVDCGYRVDCSVTPHVSWRKHLGDPQARGGSDYTGFPTGAYFVDLRDISHPAESSALLELPMTIVASNESLAGPLYRIACRGPLLLERIAHRAAPLTWLRPTGRNLRQMLLLLEHAAAEGRRYVEFMLHSSELMPNGSPTFSTEASIENLYEHLDELFAAASTRFRGATLQEYEQEVRAA